MLANLTPRMMRVPFFAELERELPTLWERFAAPEEWRAFGHAFNPHTNIAETPEKLEVTLELPGMKPEEFKVEMHAGELWITGEKKEEKEETGKTFHRVERRYGEFKRVIPLPANVNMENVAAEYKEGVLRIAIPKTEEAKGKTIPVAAA
jgi:HSP20 family protein